MSNQRYATAVLRAVTWRAVIVTQMLAALFAVTPWLEQWGGRAQPHLLFNLTEQGLSAGFIMLAAFAADEAVRRGSPVWRAFVVLLLCASAATALTEWGIDRLLDVADPRRGLERLINTFFNVGAYWGTALMVYLNRQSAARLLAGVRSGELGRAQAQRRLIGSHLAATEAQVDPAAISRQLIQVRDLYAAENPDADHRLEALIADLRNKVALCSRVQEL